MFQADFRRSVLALVWVVEGDKGIPEASRCRGLGFRVLGFGV